MTVKNYADMIISSLPFLTAMNNQPPDDRELVGYSLGNEVRGVALFKTAVGKDLAVRLKSDVRRLTGEIVFWSEQIARLIRNVEFDFVSNPPRSIRRKDGDHLATKMAQVIASLLGKPYLSVFNDDHSVDKRGNLKKHLKLLQYPYRYHGPECGTALIVDDVIWTRVTAKRCIKSTEIDLYFAVLYRG